jgi:cobalamin synthase
MSDIEERKLKVQALLEEYKTVSTELKQYTQEAMRCFPYAGILVALYLGFGLSGDASRVSSIQATIQEYIPYGFVVLCAYFLAMVYVREGLVKYRSYLEERINQTLEDSVMQLDSFSQIVTERGYLKMGRAWYARIPTPPLFLGLILILSSILVYTSDLIKKQTIVVLCLLGACAITAIYIYLIYPKLLDRIYKQDNLKKKNKLSK